MERQDLKELLGEVASGAVSVDDACARFGEASVVNLGFARPDLERGVRQGVSEVIYGAGKTAGQIVGIMAALVAAGQERVLVTRLDAAKAAEVEGLLADGGEGVGAISAGESDRPATAGDGTGSGVGKVETSASSNSATNDAAVMRKLAAGWRYLETPRMGIFGERPEPTGVGTILVVAAGTSDLYCAEEAAVTAEMLGNDVERRYDVGVAGIHRLLAQVDEIQHATAIVAVAGMEGALASVVGGLAACPVIACPTSVGYGASFGGVSALLSMLNSCASGVSVVNIDNGFGAGYQASLINHVGR